MASSIPTFNSNRSSREPCRYFHLYNSCRYGDRCFFSHDQPTNVCRYYLRGKCKYGDRCRYVHIPPELSLPNSRSQQSRNSESRSSTGSASNASMNYPNIYYNSTMNKNDQEKYFSPRALQSLCPHTNQQGCCNTLKRGRSCPYLHRDVCDLCQMPALHPTDKKQREQHHLSCSKKQEAKREEALAIEHSRDKTCGVCLEIVWNKDGDKRFGLLENCDHIFCWQCITTWRSSSNYENKLVKACPECRIKSDFITATKYWPKDHRAKGELIKNYKQVLQKIHCKHFRRGQGSCPFGSKCFYLHVDKDGRPVQLAAPRPRRRSRANVRATLEDLSDLFMISVISQAQMDRFVDGWDFLFNDDDDDDDDLMFGSYFTIEDDSSDIDEEEGFPLWD